MSAKTDRDVVRGGILALVILAWLIWFAARDRSLLVVIPAVLFVLSLIETIDAAVRLRRLRHLGLRPPRIRR